MALRSLDVEEERFLRHIMQHFGGRGSNHEAVALFNAIQSSFDDAKMGKGVTISIYLITNLAACAWVALGYDSDQRIPWDEGDHDHILAKTLRGFMWTIGGKVRNREYRTERNGAVYVESFPVPDWFVKSANQWEVNPFDG